MTHLFSPLQIRSIELKNRIGVSPMCQYSSVDGFANDWHLVHLGSRAVGGAGIVFTEATAISPQGRITQRDLGIWKEDHIPFLKKISSFIEEQGSQSGIQLAHAGRKASRHVPWEGGKWLQANEGAWQTVSASPLAFAEGEPVPKELSWEEIKEIIQDFKHAALRAREAGFKVIEIHAAHGYLIHEFLSPLSNKRTDQYGGSFENRIRFILEIMEQVRVVWPSEFPLFVRISSTDWVVGGWTELDSIRLAQVLKTRGVDVVDCSSGGNVLQANIPIAPLYQVPFSESLKKSSGLLTAAVGLITSPQEANAIIEEKRADIVLLGREMLRDPYFPLRAVYELNKEGVWPSQYERARRN
jgi:2,4-dienoyl-CoA reductase-like NADH-dependent reductase (Old Yellow Enzyme family)